MFFDIVFVFAGVSLVGAGCVGVFSGSVEVVLLRCCGVGVSGVDGGLPLDAADGVLFSSLVHSPYPRVWVAGVLAVDDAAATSSSEDRFV